MKYMRFAILLIALEACLQGDQHLTVGRDTRGPDEYVDYGEVGDSGPEARDAAEARDMGLVADTTGDLAYDGYEDGRDVMDLPMFSDESEAVSDEGIEIVQPPKRCEKTEACNVILTDDGDCPGVCVTQRYGIHCNGKVIDALCFPKDVGIENTGDHQRIGWLDVSTVKQPEKAQLNGVYDLKIDITNTSDSKVSVPFGFKNPDTWQVLSSNFEHLSELDIGPHAKFSLTARIKAMKLNLFYANKPVLSFIIDDKVFEPHAVVGLPDGQGISCGGINFPSHVDGTGPRDYYQYHSAVCCDGVFYPGAQCCNNRDCNGHACIDGRCVDQVPQWTHANILPHGKISVLIVIEDDGQGLNPCIDSSDRFTKLPFDDVERFYKGLLKQETGLDDLDFRIRVAAGVNASDFLLQQRTKPRDYFAKFSDWFIRKCGVDPEDFDKKIVVSNAIDLDGFAGQAFERGWVAVHSYERASLLAHELGHTFGATDLYLNMGGRFQYARALMNNYPLSDLGLSPALTMVSRGQWGMADADLDGVIDIAEFAVFPDSLVVTLKAVLVKNKQTIELTPHVDAVEHGVTKRVYIRSVAIDIHDLGISTNIQPDTTVGFELKTQQFSDLWNGSGRLRVHVKASYSFTDRDFVHKTLKTDRDLDVSLGKIGL